MLKVILAAVVILLLSVAGLAIRYFFDKKAEFSGGSCMSANSSDALTSKGVSCGCGGICEGEAVNSGGKSKTG